MSVITSSISCGSSLLLIASLLKELLVASVLDVVDELPISLMAKSMFSLSVVAVRKCFSYQTEWRESIKLFITPR